MRRAASLAFNVAVVAAIAASFVVATSRPGEPPRQTPCQTADTAAAAQGVPMRSCRVVSSHGVTAVLRQVGQDGTVWTTTLVRSDWRIAAVR